MSLNLNPRNSSVNASTDVPINSYTFSKKSLTVFLILSRLMSVTVMVSPATATPPTVLSVGTKVIFALSAMVERLSMSSAKSSEYNTCCISSAVMAVKKVSNALFNLKFSNLPRSPPIE